MNDIIAVEFDTTIYPLDAIRRAVHWHIGEYYADLRIAGSIVTLELRPKDGTTSPTDFESTLKNSVLDELLRVQVRSEARGIHEALIRAALDGALGRNSNSEV